MQQKDSKSARTRHFIIESTADIFNKKGYAGTSLADLTEATGLTKGSIYGNFGNKEEVAIAVFDYNAAKVTSLVAAELAAVPGFREKLLVYPRVYRSLAKTLIAHGGCPILNTSTEADDTNVALKQRATAILMQWEKTLIHLIRGGINAGEFSKSVDPKQYAVSIIALIQGGMMMAKVTNDAGYMNLVLNTAGALIGEMEK